MLRRFISEFLFVCSLLLSPLGWAADQPSSITIGINPGGSPENVKKQGLEFAQLLQNELGISVNIYIPKDYQGLIDAMKAKKVDFAFFSTLTFVYAEEQAQAKVLLKKIWASPFYYSTVITRTDSGIKDISQIKLKNIAFVDPHSTSGYLYPQVMLKKRGIKDSDFKSIQFSGNHSASIALLEKKIVDVAAVFSDDKEGKEGAWQKFASDKKIKYKILWMSEPIPNDPFCVRQDFYDQYPKLTHTLMVSIIDLFQKNKQSKRFTELLGSQDLMLATTKQYDPVREMVKTLKVGVSQK